MEGAAVTEQARERQRAEAAEALALARALRAAGRRPELAYRCRGGSGGRSGCLLLAVYPSAGGGPLLYAPARRLQKAHATQVLAGDELPEFAALLATLEAAAGGDGVSLAGLTECRHSSVKRDPLTVATIRADLAGGANVVVLPRHADERP